MRRYLRTARRKRPARAILDRARHRARTLSKCRLRGIGPRYSAALGRDPRYRLSDIIEFMNTKMAANTREAQTVRPETASVIGVRYTARRQTRPIGRRA